MKYVKGFFAFWYDFIVGDAWEVAVGVVLALLGAYLLSRYAPGPATSAGLAILLPIVIMSLLTYSIWRVPRQR
jgi:hypothetical protein